MNKITKAIIMAAGKGERLLPVTLTTPKPLVKVNGVRMIDTIIDALHHNNIFEIYIVVGYLKEQFFELEKEYDGVKIIENPYYKECNNISSLYVARDYIDDTIILDGDQIIYNADILSPFFEKSGYNAIYVENETNEWLMQVNDNKVTSCSRIGGNCGWQLFSVSRWTHEDGIKLRKHLELEFDTNRNRQIYWDDVPMFYHFDEYDLGIFEMKKEDITEIDNIYELIEQDNSYTEYFKGGHYEK